MAEWRVSNEGGPKLTFIVDRRAAPVDPLRTVAKEKKGRRKRDGDKDGRRDTRRPLALTGGPAISEREGLSCRPRYSRFTSTVYCSGPMGFDVQV
jgi:hypothetical protein